MRRRTVLFGGVILSLMYSLMLLVSVFLLIFSVLYTFFGDSMQIVEDIFKPLLSPFMTFGEDKLFVTIGIVTLVALFSLICASRFIKYSDYNQEKFVSKKGLYIFYLVWLVICCGLYLYVLLQNINQGGFSVKLIENIILCAILGLQVLSIFLLIFGVAGQKYEKLEEKQEQNPEHQAAQPDENINWNDYISHDEAAQTEQVYQVPKRTPIYTAGLDGDEDDKIEEPETQTKKIEKRVRPLPESNTTKQAISGITQLDEMRKEGKISLTQYTKLRNKLIKKLTKNT